jgi:heme-degrading monooxygenase HmoA
MFARASGFIETRLLRPADGSDWWLTIDSWDSADAFNRFQAEHGEAYAELDKELEGVAGEERFVGEYEDR